MINCTQVAHKVVIKIGINESEIAGTVFAMCTPQKNCIFVHVKTDY